MYTAYFGLNENPFSLTPDPRFLFMSQRYREALAHLIYGMGDRGGFVLLTGEVGTGKTTLCRSLLEQVPEGVEVALVLNPKQTALELVASLCDELRVPYPAGTDSLKILIDLLNRRLLQIHGEGRRTVLIIDEAQNLSADVLEQVRLLTNLETTTSKLLQILLIGQPELQAKMARPELRQLAQRITARYHLSPLLSNETVAYVQHRLEVAGCKRCLFTDGAMRRVYSLSGGVPRLINTICDRALLGAYARKLDCVRRRMVRKAAVEVMGSGGAGRRFSGLAWASGIGVCLLLWAGWQFFFSPMMEKGRLIPKEGPAGLVSAGPQGGLKISGPERGAEEITSIPPPALAQPEGQSAPPEGIPENTKADTAKGNGTELPPGVWFLAETAPTDVDTAFKALFEGWGTTYWAMPGVSPCERAARAGLRCYKDRGNWTTLRHLNRPVILELVDPGQRRHYVAAVRLEGRTLSLQVGDQDVVLDLDRIEPFWFGDFTLLWKPPPLTPLVMKEGDRGPHVLWLRAQLALADGGDERLDETGAEGPANPLFDGGLKERVMAFQQARLVKADGIVGDQTLIQLNQASPDTDGPLLSTQAGDGDRHVANP